MAPAVVYITVTSTITGTGGLTVVDTTAGAIAINAANNYTGTTTLAGNLTSGSVTVGNISAFGNSAVNFVSGVLANGVGANFVLANPVNFTNSVASFGNSGNRFFLAGPITLTGNNQIIADANATVNQATFLSGVVGGTGALTLLGGALMIQNPNNT